MFAMQQKGQLKRDQNTVVFYLVVHVRGFKKSISAVKGTGWSAVMKLKSLHRLLGWLLLVLEHQ